LRPEVGKRLLLLGVAERAVMGIMGRSSTAMAARYQHITDRSDATSPDELADCRAPSRSHVRRQ
jgi:hypothetical protein